MFALQLYTDGDDLARVIRSSDLEIAPNELSKFQISLQHSEPRITQNCPLEEIQVDLLI